MKLTRLKFHIRFTEPILGSSSGNPDIHQEFVAARAATAAETKEEVAAIPKSPDEVAEDIEKASTIFPCDEEGRGTFAWNYQARGFFKEATLALIELGQFTGLTKWTYKKAVDAFLFVKPRRIFLLKPEVKIADLPNNGLWLDHKAISVPDAQKWVHAALKWEDGKDGKPGKFVIPDGQRTNERPLRAETMKGERVALARSQELPVGTQAVFAVDILTPDDKGKDEDEEEGDDGKKKKVRRTNATITIDHLFDCLHYGSLKGWGQWRGGGWGTIIWEQLGKSETLPWPPPAAPAGLPWPPSIVKA
jgi:hypothetical protein